MTADPTQAQAEGEELRRALHQAACDPGAVAGFKRDRSLGQWMCDAIDLVLSRRAPPAAFIGREAIERIIRTRMWGRDYTVGPAEAATAILTLLSPPAAKGGLVQAGRKLVASAGEDARIKALREIKRTALTAVNAPRALTHIVRLCIDAGVTDQLPAHSGHEGAGPT